MNHHAGFQIKQLQMHVKRTILKILC